MASYNGSIYAIQDANGIEKLRPTDLGGKVRCAHGTFAPTAALASGSVINLVKLPVGSRVLPISKLWFGAGQAAAMTVKCGDSGDDDRYLGETTVGTAAKGIALEALAGDTTGYVNPGETTIEVTIGGSTYTASKTLVYDIYYTVD